ncbi:hypothetical protein STRATTON_116 [Erwinia phage vB_EamM_Stratton]|uniref:Uncharacterized protein n=2 Tax=Erskinevirus EaH2 TaxID=2169883 RepID=A0A1B2IGZ1_9CAUD|nr:hypothetical protein G173_gp021 [Erwinia phage phiEaH2]AFQ96566.1 hypothetical protein [Erwinia phage phiEaH2]ANZ50541.1 hypothetical protein STRATTON_116 [Erwinia phage vB_EamM_Stratton]
MFYDELRKYTHAISAGNISKDNNLQDVVDVVGRSDDVLYVDVDEAFVAEGVKRVQLTVRAKAGSCSLSFRVSAEFFIPLRCYFSHDGDVYPARWNDNYQKFGYPLEEHRRTVYDFMKSVIEGF